jgi:hypothetical protein
MKRVCWCSAAKDAAGIKAAISNAATGHRDEIRRLTDIRVDRPWLATKSLLPSCGADTASSGHSKSIARYDV